MEQSRYIDGNVHKRKSIFVYLNNPVNLTDPTGMYIAGMGCNGGRSGFWHRGEYESCGGGGGASSKSSGHGIGTSADYFEYKDQSIGTNARYMDWYISGGREGVEIEIKDWYDDHEGYGGKVYTSTTYKLINSTNKVSFDQLWNNYPSSSISHLNPKTNKDIFSNHCAIM